MQKKQNIIYGKHPVLEAISSNASIEKIFLQKNISREVERELRAKCKEHDISIQYVPKEKLNRLCSGIHQGIVAHLSLIKYSKLSDIIPFVYEQSESPLFLILDGITDVRNFGAIARSAELGGVHAIIIPEKGGAAVNEDAMKTSAGALNRIAVCREKDLVKIVEEFKMNGVQVVASILDGSKMIYDCDLTGPTALILGSEDKGVNSKLRGVIDDSFIIPQKGKGNSFNVSVAAGIMLYETSRQRMKS